ARPALAAGMALAVMETLADYGAVSFLSVQTLTTGVVRAWSVYGSTASAARLALPLLGAAALLLWLERWGRQGRGFEASSARWRSLPTTRLTGLKAWGATGFCLLLVGAGLLLPAAWPAWAGLSASPGLGRLLRAAGHAFGLGLTGALITVLLAPALALGARKLPLAARVASIGYATPGAVMAIGLLAPAAWLWQSVPGAASGFGIGLVM